MLNSETTNKIVGALLKFHKNPPSIVKEGVVSMHGKDRKYLTLDSIMHAVRPALAEQGVFIMQHLTGDNLVTVLMHESGEYISSSLPFQTMNGSGTNNLQNLGGGLTYLRRYALCAILAIAADEDDDGAKGGIEKGKAKEEDPRPWLNPNSEKWADMIKAIELGTVKTIDQIEKHYRISKATKEEINKLLNPIK